MALGKRPWARWRSRRTEIPRPRLGPHLYLDPQRKDWSIRDGALKKRLGFLEAQRVEAEMALHEYVTEGSHRPSVFVYFMTAEEPDYPIKIGVTQSRFERFRGLQNGCPYPLHLCGMIEATCLLEQRLHRRLREHRMVGEWFARTQDVIEVCRDICRQNGSTFSLPSTGTTTGTKSAKPIVNKTA